MKIQSAHMFPMMCSHPPCMNMLVTSGQKSPAGNPITGAHSECVNRAGTMPKSSKNRFNEYSGIVSSIINTSAFARMMS